MTFPRNFQEVSRKFPGNFHEISGKFLQQISGNFPGKLPEDFREISTKFPGNSGKNPRTPIYLFIFPEKVRKNSLRMRPPGFFGATREYFQEKNSFM